MFAFKSFKRIVTVLLILCFAVIFCACEDNTSLSQEITLIRIHIRANSNSKDDQAVKLRVRDSVNEYLSAELKGITEYEKAMKKLNKLLSNIESIANKSLSQNGFSYSCKARVKNEFFPTRSYEGVVVESGYYDALILELGEGVGDNWWCVIYPPLCYTVVKNNGDKIEYKSYFAEFFKKYFK